MNVKISATKEEVAVGKAQSKLILIGEHAVVHGEPAIAVPFPMVGSEVTVEFVPGPIQINSKLYHGPLDLVPDDLKGIERCIKSTLDYLNLPPKDLYIRIHSSVPLQRGLGSSASVAIAIVRSLFAYNESEYTKEQLLELANISETVAHGAPSGIDTLTITSKYPVWFEKDQELSHIELASDFHFVVVDTGSIGDTRTAVESVTELFKKAPVKIQKSMNRIGRLTYQAKKALERTGKQLLGSILNEAQKELETLGVSNATLDRLIDFARQEGALGAKLTGAGNGGCLIALAKNKTHSRQLAKKLLQFGAHAVWPFVLKQK